MRASRIVLLSLAACAGAEPPIAEESHQTRGGAGFDVPALLEGAFSDVPDEVLAAYPAIFGGSHTRHTRITGVEFHIPGVISSHALSPVPVPILREVNGTRYLQVSGELSALIVDDLGIYKAVGPIDSAGVNHRNEVFDPLDPEGNDPDDTAGHPRAGLPGAFFIIRWPAEGFSGRIIQHQAPNDGGYSFPQAPVAWMPVDVLELLRQGYAAVSVLTGSTAYARVNADGSLTVDTNPESGSGIFWTEDWDLWAPGGVWQTEHTALVPYLRSVRVDDAFNESAYPVHTSVELYVPEYNEETGEFGLVITDDFIVNPFFSWPAPHGAAPELLRDAAVVFKNFMVQATGVMPHRLWTCYLGWSGSGVAAWQLAAGKQNNALVLTDRALGSPPNAGNFNRWRDPSSGRRFDAFVVFAGGMPWPWFMDDTDLDAALVSADVDPEFPVGAPYVFLHGDADIIVPTANPYLQANAVARAWSSSSLAGESIDAYLSILQLDTVNHGSRDQIFTTRDEPPFEGGVWWDPALGDAPDSLNEERRGLRITDEFARMWRQTPQDDLQGFAALVHTFPRTTPLYLALFDRLAHGGQMPTSRVDPKIFDHLDQIDGDTRFPLYDLPCDTSWESPFEDLLACRDGLMADGSMVLNHYLPGEVAAFHEFATSNPLSRSTEPLVVPDVGARLGWFYFLGAFQLRRDFTDAELEARYGTHRGYVDAFKEATGALVADRLWDPQVGKLYVDGARASDVLGGRRSSRANDRSSLRGSAGADRARTVGTCAEGPCSHSFSSGPGRPARMGSWLLRTPNTR